MTQPDYVPLIAEDRIRPSDHLAIPGPWVPDRPAELVTAEPPRVRRLGSTGPDLGYGLKLAKRFGDRFVLAEGEDPHDVVAGCFVCGTRRAARFGRAPVIFDMEWAYALWGYLAVAPDDLVSFRRPLFRGADHDYSSQRRIADSVAPESLELSPAGAHTQVGAEWRSAFVA